MPRSHISPRKQSKSKNPRDTPAMRQFRGFKEAYPDCVLFFRMGDFYEMFDEDAHTVHKALGLTLTQRSSGIPMAGIPWHAAEGYLHKMIVQGYRVAVCDQIQDPAEAKGVVERAVTRVLTPGTLIDESLLDAGMANTTAFITIDHAANLATIATAELSTGRFEVLRTDPSSIVDEVSRLGPSELLVTESCSEHPAIARAAAATGCAITRRPDWTTNTDEGERLLRSHWDVGTLEGWGFQRGDVCTAPQADCCDSYSTHDRAMINPLPTCSRRYCGTFRASCELMPRHYGTSKSNARCEPDRPMGPCSTHCSRASPRWAAACSVTGCASRSPSLMQSQPGTTWSQLSSPTAMRETISLTPLAESRTSPVSRDGPLWAAQRHVILPPLATPSDNSPPCRSGSTLYQPPRPFSHPLVI